MMMCESCLTGCTICEHEDEEPLFTPPAAAEGALTYEQIERLARGFMEPLRVKLFLEDVRAALSTAPAQPVELDKQEEKVYNISLSVEEFKLLKRWSSQWRRIEELDPAVQILLDKLKNL